MADCGFSCRNLGACPGEGACCHTCLYYYGGECSGAIEGGYYPRHFVRYLTH